MSANPSNISIQEMFAKALAVEPVKHTAPTEAERKKRFEEILQETVASRNIKPHKSNSSTRRAS